MKKKEIGFTLIELLVVIILIGVLMAIAIPAVRNLTYNNDEKRYQTLEKLVYEASKLYVKNYRGEITNADSDCFNVPYETLVNEGLIEEEDISCTGNIIIDNTSENKYQAYLTCKNKKGKIIHDAAGGMPLHCKGFNGNFTVNYNLYEDVSHTNTYQEGDWSKYVYGTYSSSNPYNIEVDHYEYTTDLLNWKTLNPSNQEYQNYNGNVYVRAIDKAGNVSNINNHIVRADSKGPTFDLSNDEHKIVNGNQMEVKVTNIVDNGVGVDKSGLVYSFDGGASWTDDASHLYSIESSSEVQVKDKLGNITANPVKTIYSCSSGDGDATASQILSGRTAWAQGRKITGTMPNRGELNWKPSDGTTYTVPAGYYSGGTLDSSDAYNKGYEDGYEQGQGQGTSKRVKLGSCSTTASFDLKSYEGYQNFTNENFAMIVTGININAGDWSKIDLYNQSPSMNYNASTGILSVASARRGVEISSSSSGNKRSQSDVVVDIYLYY